MGFQAEAAEQYTDCVSLIIMASRNVKSGDGEVPQETDGVADSNGRNSPQLSCAAATNDKRFIPYDGKYLTAEESVYVVISFCSVLIHILQVFGEISR